MSKLLVVVAVLGLGAVVYAKVIRSAPEERACERLDSLCGGEVDIGECTEGFAEAEKLVGEKVIEKATDCMADADTCMEAVGCMAGAGSHVIDELEQGFERGRR